MQYPQYSFFSGLTGHVLADSKEICLHNKGTYVAKLSVSDVNTGKTYETGNIDAAQTKCVAIPDNSYWIVINAEVNKVAGWKSICTNGNGAYANQLPSNTTITTTGTLFKHTCSGMP